MCPRGRGQEWGLALGLLLLPFLVTSTQGPSDVIATSGSNTSLQILEPLPESYTQLTWFLNTQQKIVEWEAPNSTTYYNSQLKGRVKLDPQNPAHLNIYMVWKNDSSTYLMRVSQESGKEQEWKIRLQVFDPVPEPVINIEKTEEMEGNCYVNLSCVIHDDQAVTYVWYRDSGPFPKELQGSVLAVTLTPRNQSKFYTCQASNPVSSKNDTVYFTPPCTLARSSGVTWIAHGLTTVTVPIIFYLLLT